jgi:hypothetical protein
MHRWLSAGEYRFSNMDIGEQGSDLKWKSALGVGHLRARAQS